MRLLMAAVLAAWFVSTAGANEKLKGVACRSVHLGYPAGEGTAFFIEMTVKKSAAGTYFMACGWDKGYFGIQEQGGGKKVVIFSVWDSAQNDRNATPEEDRVKMLYKDEKVRIGRFGGEGSGGQSFMDCEWKVGEKYSFMVTAVPDGRRTEYTGFFLDPAVGTWRRLVTFSTVTGGKPLKGYYSFVEDFKRNKISTTFARRAEYDNGWVKETSGRWTPLTRARFTADANPVTNIDAGTTDGRFFLITGGETENTGTKLRAEMKVDGKPTSPPKGLPAVPTSSSRSSTTKTND